MKRIFIVIAELLAMSSLAQASTLASSAIFGGGTQNNAVCYVFNAGAAPISILSKQIYEEFNVVLPISATNCSASLPAGAICYILSTIGSANAHACAIVVSPDGASVRGAFEIRGGGTVLNKSDLR